MKKNNLNKPTKINVIPILDAVFIFIFFLLLSAQFLDLFELNVSKPIFKDAPETTDNSDGGEVKNFKLILNNSQIKLTSGVSENVIFKTGWSDSSLEKLSERIYKLKLQNLKVNSMVIKPSPSLKYKKVVKVIDLAQKKYNTEKINGKLFRTIAFESME